MMLSLFQKTTQCCQNNLDLGQVFLVPTSYLSISHKTFSEFDDGHQVSGVFLDISKASDRIWRGGLVFKLQQSGIPGEIINFKKTTFSYQKQRVVLNGQQSSWADVKAGVP